MIEIDSFNADFESLLGFPPFHWQRRLFDLFRKGDIPPALDLPTGLGKTSVIAIWLIARAYKAAVPRRLVYVVDRRVVVDQATEEAEKLREALEFVPKLKTALGLQSDRSLPISTLRGAHVDNREWLADPSLPAIIIGTVDMIGSRLLFEGYGVSRKMRPYHAGLLGLDTLVVVDEAHIVPPFEKLLETIETDVEVLGAHTEDERSVIPGFKLLSLSATHVQTSTENTRRENVFHLSGADIENDPIVQKRLMSKKSLELVSLGEKEKLEEALARQAWKLAHDGAENIRCIIYCNSRKTADKTQMEMEKISRGKAEVLLFVGARRAKEREDAKRGLREMGFLEGAIQKDKPVFLIATSAGEVGIDLDADHMVCDLVPWERVVQRLGRVNRRGDKNARVILIHEGEQKSSGSNEQEMPEKWKVPAYATLALVDELPQPSSGKFCVNPDALRKLELKAKSNSELREKIKNATSHVPLRPALTRPLLDAWSMTSLEERAGRPDITPWLRGWIEEEKPQTSIVWRTYLPVRLDGVEVSDKEIEAFFDAASPHESERLETETYRVVDWLIERAAKAKVDNKKQENIFIAFVLTLSGDIKKKYTVYDILGNDDKKGHKEKLNRELAGMTIIVDSRLKGLAKNGLIDQNCDEEISTADGGDWLLDLNARSVAQFYIYEDAVPEKKKANYTFARRRSEDGDEKILFIETYQTEESRSTSAKAQILAEHHSWTERCVLAIAENIGLTGNYKKSLAIAARLHDEGKKSERWQRAFNAKPQQIGELFAKTKGPIRHTILDGYRHEFGSLRYVEEDAEFAALPLNFQDLVLHIIAAHHGRARPFIETKSCDDAPPLILQGRARDVALRFARLQKQWGPWGLAWWESLLRAADQQASRENDRVGASSG